MMRVIGVLAAVFVFASCAQAWTEDPETKAECGRKLAKLRSRTDLTSFEEAIRRCEIRSDYDQICWNETEEHVPMDIELPVKPLKGKKHKRQIVHACFYRNSYCLKDRVKIRHAGPCKFVADGERRMKENICSEQYLHLLHNHWDELRERAGLKP